MYCENMQVDLMNKMFCQKSRLWTEVCLEMFSCGVKVKSAIHFPAKLSTSWFLNIFFLKILLVFFISKVYSAVDLSNMGMTTLAIYIIGIPEMDISIGSFSSERISLLAMEKLILKL